MCCVWIWQKGNKIATVTEDGKMTLETEAEDVKSEVDKYMQEWCEKKGFTQ